MEQQQACYIWEPKNGQGWKDLTLICDITIWFKSLGLVRSFMLTNSEYIWSKYTKNCNNVVKKLFQFKITYFLLLLEFILKCNVFLCWKSWISTAITPVFSVTWSFRIADLVLKKHFLCWKRLCCLIFCFQDSLIGKINTAAFWQIFVF